MPCPLCNANNSINVRRTSLTSLKRDWIRSFGFDPFPIEFPTDHVDKKRCTSCGLEFFDPTFYGDAKFYSQLSKNAWYYEENKWEYDVAAAFVAQYQPRNLLEIGCGNGFFLDKIRGLEIQAEGIDINPDAIKSGLARGLAVSLTDLYDVNKQFDMVVLFEVLEHMDHLGGLFDCLTTKLLKKGGYLIIAVPNPNSYLREIETNLLDMPPHHNSAWSYECFEKLQSKFGLTLVAYNKEPIRLIHYDIYIQSLLKGVEKISVKSWKSRIFYRAQSFIIRMLMPLIYIRSRTDIDGQTHLVVFRNDA